MLFLHNPNIDPDAAAADLIEGAAAAQFAGGGAAATRQNTRDVSEIRAEYFWPVLRPNPYYP